MTAAAYVEGRLVVKPALDADLEPVPEPSATITDVRAVDDAPWTPPGASGLPVRDPERYEIRDVLGCGGLGRVLVAYDCELERLVAVKEMLQPGRRAEVRFVREARIAARLQHPGIVPVHDVGRWPTGEAFYTMTLVAGRTLDECIAGAPAQRDRLLLLPHALAVADAIAYAHSRGVIHRDLKPANVVVGDYGTTVVVDWGLAKELAARDAAAQPGWDSDAAVTSVGDVLGTPAYMPPEQARGERVDRRADVYALGATLYHLLMGFAPYAGEKTDEVVWRVAAARPPDPLPAEIDAPQRLVAVVTRAMAPDPIDRYADAGELATALRRAIPSPLRGEDQGGGPQ